MPKFNESQSKECKILSIDTIYENGVYSKTIIVLQDDCDNQYTIEDLTISDTSTNIEIKNVVINKLMEIDKITPITVEIKSNSNIIDIKVGELY